VLGHVLELAADKPFHKLMDEYICEPLKLKQTAIQSDDSLRPATGYDRRDWRVEQTHSFKERLAGSGGLVTSIDDLGTFLAAQLQPDVFTREILDQLHTKTKLSYGFPAGTALGWTIAAPTQDAPVMREAVDHVLEKNGGRSNCSAWIGFAPDHQVAVAVVTNCGGPYVDPIGRRLLEQAVPPSQKRLPEARYARVSPYSGVRWENDRPVVRIDDEWYDLLAVDGISVDRIVGFAKEQYGSRARKRVAEDLIQILAELGHDPDWEVTLDLRTQDGTTLQQDVLMTERNRDQVRS
jgi:CubicO group peptidase (beta-lactamase class C family)